MSVLPPIFVLVALTAVTLFRLARARLRALGGGAVPMDYYRTYDEGREPEECRVLARHYSNLFEAPVLFYVAALLLLVWQRETVLTVGLAWLYVLLRVAHSIVHTTTNNVLWRFRLFGLSWMVLVALWSVLAWIHFG